MAVEYRTTKDAAKVLGVSRRMVNKLIEEGVMESEKLGGQHVIDEIEIERVAALDRPSGYWGHRERVDG